MATSTLAQGMNLPSEIVIISGDSRFDAGANRVEQLEAHEILNAAGRAGRAGENSHGFVLVIPSKVVYFDDEKNEIHKHWADLRSIFSLSDQCLVIDDPLLPILDNIQENGVSSSISKYLLRKLPVNSNEEIDVNDAARKALNRSFGAYRARRNYTIDQYNNTVEKVLEIRKNLQFVSDKPEFCERVAAAAGIDLGVVKELALSIDSKTKHINRIYIARNWLLTWLSERPHLIPLLIREESLESFLGKKYSELNTDVEKGIFALNFIKPMLILWTKGATLKTLEKTYLEIKKEGSEENLGKCENARTFVLKIVADMAYIFGLPAQIITAKAIDDEEDVVLPLSFEKLNVCIKEGFNSLETLAIRVINKGSKSRVMVHHEYKALKRFIQPSDNIQTFAEYIHRIEIAEFLRDNFSNSDD